jgi:subtilisin-like proprotein convertase family protein
VDLNVPATYQARHGDYGVVMKYRSSKPNEYFIVENRSKQGLDRALPSSGLAVYHCDTLGSNEFQHGTAAHHYQCALLQADGRRDLESNANQGDGADLFSVIGGVALSSNSNPATREWDGRDSGLVIADIDAPTDSIDFRTGGAAPAQNFQGIATPNLAIPDNNPVGVSSTIAATVSGVVGRLRVTVDIPHTYIGDLQVELFSPGGRRAILHSRSGASQHDLRRSYDSSSPGQLSNMLGQPVQGTWTLSVRDLEAVDVGTLASWSLNIDTSPI